MARLTELGERDDSVPPLRYGCQSNDQALLHLCFIHLADLRYLVSHHSPLLSILLCLQLSLIGEHASQPMDAVCPGGQT